MTAHNPLKYFKTSPKIIRLAVMYYVRYPQSFHQVEDILHERGIDISHEALLVCLNQKHYTNMVGSLQIYNIASGL